VAALNKKARSLFSKNEKIIESIDEIEKFLKTEKEYQELCESVNRFVLVILFTDSEGIEIKDDVFTVTDIGKVQINPELKSLVKFDPKKIKDEKVLAQSANGLVKDAGLLAKLEIDLKKFNTSAKKAYKDREDLQPKFKDINKKIAEFENKKGRYQVLNRHILQLVYADALQLLEPVKKAGVISRSEDQGESGTRMTEYKQVGGSAVINQIEAGYAGRIYVDPNDDKKLYAVEVRTVVSKDGGKTFRAPAWIGRHR